MKTKPKAPVRNVPGDFEQFKSFARQILSVPHSEIKATLEAEKRGKRTPKSASRAVADSSSRA